MDQYGGPEGAGLISRSESNGSPHCLNISRVFANPITQNAIPKTVFSRVPIMLPSLRSELEPAASSREIGARHMLDGKAVKRTSV
jgi:hypothetical protein